MQSILSSLRFGGAMNTIVGRETNSVEWFLAAGHDSCGSCRMAAPGSRIFGPSSSTEDPEMCSHSTVNY